MKKTTTIAGSLALIAGVASADFETDFGVATDGAGALAVEFNFDSIELISEFVEGGGSDGSFTGFFSEEPGFANFEEDEEDEGLFVVPDGTVVAFELVSADPAFVVYDPFFDAPVPAGSSFVLGTVNVDAAGAVTGFDDHPFWTIDVNDAGFDDDIFDYDVTFRLVDVRDDGITPLTATENITVTFSRIPTPGTAAVLGLAGLATARRRR
ncbi:MAG: hypothetical protein AAGF47_09560 [Planctomycetota bacterium]